MQDVLCPKGNTHKHALVETVVVIHFIVQELERNASKHLGGVDPVTLI